MPAAKTVTRAVVPPPSAATAGWGRWFAPVLLAVAIIGTYANTLKAPFVYDDAEAIAGNSSIRSLWPLGPVLVPSTPGGATVSGRPVLNLSFALNHAISGYAVESYHTVNIAIHLGSALLLLGILLRTLPRALGEDSATTEKLSALIAALWALHPLQTQAVTYTVQRAESLMGFFYLLTVYALARAVEGEADDQSKSASGEAAPVEATSTAITRARSTRRWLVVSGIACLLGMATKEVMATAPVLVLLYDRTFVAGSFRAAWSRRRGYYLGLAATWLVLGALVASTGGNRGGTVGLGVGVPLWAYPLTQFLAVARYLWLSVWPRELVFEYGQFWAQSAGDVLPYAAVILPLLALTAWALVRRPKLGFLGAWFFLILAPTSLAPGTIQMVVEHRMYLPLAAVVVLVVLALRRWLARAALAVGAVAVLACTGLTIARNHDYRSHLAIWEKTVAQRPDNPRAREGLAEAYEELDRWADAAAQRREAVRLKPDEPTYHYNLGLDLAMADQLDAATRAYEQSLRLNPSEPRAHNNLALVLARVGRTEEALRHHAEAVRLQPNNAQFVYNLAAALARAGKTSDAIVAFETTLRLRPDYPNAHFKLGNALITADRVPESIPHYEAALAAQPNDAEAHHNLGIAFARLERYAEARREFEIAVQLKPDYPEAQQHLAQVRQVMGETR